MLNDLITALTLLTVLPAPSRAATIARPLGRSMAWFPAVGLLLGGILVFALWLLRMVFPDLVVAALVLAVWAMLTGALHLEALADTGDGLLATVPRDKRLEIMHDPRVGAFGAVTLGVVLLIKFAALASLTDIGLVVLAPVLARWGMVLAATFPPVSATGMAAMFRQGLGRRELVIATVTAALVAVPFGVRGVAAFALAAAAVLLVARVALARLGGLNGDIYGATGELVETIVLLIGTMRV